MLLPNLAHLSPCILCIFLNILLYLMFFRYIPVTGGYIAIISIAIFSLFFNLPRFFELKTATISYCDSFVFAVQPTELRLSPNYSTLNMLFSVIFVNLLPFTCLLFINTRIYKVVQQKIQILQTLNRRKVKRTKIIVKELNYGFTFSIASYSTRNL